ncbi:hypothetical protein G9F72_015015 [Clostridium estertheticum]|uniref:hypothetical protein n=1 Tax=Clostridium estertheticum TaxID=238834 RepID=UPI0013E91524|nr:hypothetical protein [Clostridium estertheticum]MBZ9687641.1 hypothetical protein [Clostridium estertheticum]
MKSKKAKSKGFFCLIIHFNLYLNVIKKEDENIREKLYATDIVWADKQTKNIKAIMDNFSNSNLYFDVPKYLY